MKEFNITGTCIPTEHYMVNLSKKRVEIIRLIEKGYYFTMNRARQYGKTTMFADLYRALKNKYLVIRLSFEGVGELAFSDDLSFMHFFIDKIADFLEFTEEPGELARHWSDISDYQNGKDAFYYLDRKITKLCKESTREVLLLIDEVDKSSDNQIFLDFLGMLRNKYLRKKEALDYTFKSVILAGVYDIKNLKLKLRPDAERKYNSPWNIAVDFNVDMSFCPEEIETMLDDYEQEHHTGMNKKEISESLYFYTSGYPFLVSWLCKWMDESAECRDAIWTAETVKNAQKAILKTRTTLLDDLIKNVENQTELKTLITHMLYYGKTISYNLSVSTIQLGVILGIFKEREHNLVISNLVFESYLYDYTINLKSLENIRIVPERSQFIENGKLNMPQILKKFQEVMRAEYREANQEFLEEQGRLLFLCFLKPIINGTGFYYVEPQTRNNTRMDIVISYGGEEHVCELKIWHGQKYRRDGLRQLEDYMENRNCKIGYLVSFSFLKKKKYICDWISEKETSKKIYEVVI